MKYYLIAGEASGDLHGANLISGLRKSDPQAVFRFWGGDRMCGAAGGECLARHYRTASFFGFAEVVKNLRTILSQLGECRRDIAAFAPDVLVLIDYPGFNFRMAKFAHRLNIPVFYYISPKVWAWKQRRVELIRRYVDRLFIIFPFEREYFAARGIEAIFEGNPLVDAVEQGAMALPSRDEFLRLHDIPDDRPLVALLAGSRASEIRHNLPLMVSLAKKFPDYRFVVAGVSWLERESYDRILAGSDVLYVSDATYALLRYSEAALVTSGTATLETALLDVPEVVLYRSDEISMRIGRLVLKIPFISLVNLILGREAVRELIQWDMTPENAETELRAVLPGGAKRETMKSDFAELRRLVGPPGASDRFAARMVSILKDVRR